MKKEKLTLQEQLTRRTYKKPNKLIWWVLKNIVIRLFLAPPMHIHHEVVNPIDCDSGAFLFYNHQSRADYTWLVFSTKKPINFVVGYNEFFRSHLAGVAKLLHFIPKKNFNTDIPAFKAMAKIIKDKGVVCMAPEGMASITGHNQPVAIGTGKLLKHFKVPVYCCRSQGGYLFNHKVCLDNRYGRIDAKTWLMFTPEDLEKLTPQEIEDKLNEVLWEDDYVWQQQEHIKWKTKGRIATRMHDICYKCPDCGTEFNLLGEKDILECKTCGAKARMNDYYEWEPLNDGGKKFIDTPSHWVDWERKLVYKEIQDPNFEFKEHVKIGKIPEDHMLKNHLTSELCGEGDITINHEGFFYKGTKDGEPFEFCLKYSAFPTVGMATTVEFFCLYVDGKYYDIFPDRPSVMKIVLLVEEMHRFHGGPWKNFPWADTYKD